MNILDKFRTGLKKTSVFLTSNISHSFTSNKVTPAMIENIETALISADISLEVTNLLINKIKKMEQSVFISKNKYKRNIQFVWIFNLY